MPRTRTVDNSRKIVDNSTQLWRIRSLVRRNTNFSLKVHPHIWASCFNIFQIWKVGKNRVNSPLFVQDFSTLAIWLFCFSSRIWALPFVIMPIYRDNRSSRCACPHNPRCLLIQLNPSIYHYYMLYKPTRHDKSNSGKSGQENPQNSDEPIFPILLPAGSDKGEFCRI